MIVPLRNLSKYGILPSPDTSKYNLPPEAWSFGQNVRFTNGSVERGPVFRTADTLSEHPRFAVANSPVTGFDSVIIGYKNGRLSSWSSGTETDVSITDYVDADAETPFTSTVCNEVLYVNRSDRVPWMLTPTASKFAALENWDSTHRANIIRSLNGALVALGVTRGATVYPTGVMTSEFADAGAEPADWDETDPTSNATFNDAIGIKGAIVDAQTLGDALYIYSNRETWRMVLDPGSENVWHYELRFADAGAINANCAVEVDGKHFVFGPRDIWVHDGNSKESICDARTRRFIFSTINISKANRCFVHYDENRKEILFCYVSGDRGVHFTGGDGCNRAAVYNLIDNVWSFDDLPLVHSAAFANLDTVLTWETVTATWDSVGGTYLDQEDSQKKLTVFVGESSTAFGLSASLYAFDMPNTGSLVAFDVDANATRPAYLEKDGVDLDELAAELRGYKIVTSIYPQATLAAPIEFTVGAADYFNQPVEYRDWQEYDGAELYKLDFNAAGRFLSLKLRQTGWDEFVLSGLDFDIDVLGDR